MITILTQINIPTEASSFLVSLICNLIASSIFLFIVFILLRPRITIAEVIARNVDEKTNQTKFVFKICNKSFFRAYDIKIELYRAKTVRNSGNHIELQNIGIFKSVSAAPSLAKYKLIDRIQKAKQNETYEFALQVRTLEDIEPILKDPQKFIRLQVEARHGLTGLQSIFVQDYDDTSCICDGTFQSGKGISIKH
jgi:hypothetical protein